MLTGEGNKYLDANINSRALMANKSMLYAYIGRVVKMREMQILN